MAEDPDGFARVRELTLGVESGALRAIAAQTMRLLDRNGATSPPWSGFLAIDRDQNVIVGTCSFVAPPDSRGDVEIAYFTFPDFEGRGVASAMAKGLIECARGRDGVRRFIAHTLRESNASTRILQKIGFVQTGQVVDPEEGLVWRWERDEV